jgi:hypothetical protein
LGKSKGAIENEQSRDIGNIGHIRRRTKTKNPENQPWVTDETISRTTMFFLVKRGTCFKRQFGSL